MSFSACRHLSGLEKFAKETLINVIPVQAGIYKRLIFLDSSLRGSDESGLNQSFPNKR
jgi:hypothetical protein